MNYKKLKILYKKEILDVIRDKKTVLVTVVLPVILYPLIFLGVIQIMSMVNQTQQEKTYYIAYSQVEDANRIALNEWIESDEDELEYLIKEVESDNPEKDLEEEVIDAYITTSEKEGKLVYEIHYLSAVTDSLTLSGMLEEEIEAYSTKQAEKNVEQAGMDVEQVLYPIKMELTDRSSNESSIGSVLGTIIPFLLITSILTGSMFAATDATAGEKERGTLETLLTLPISNLELIMSKFLAVATISVFSVLINVAAMGGIAAYLYASFNVMAEEGQQFSLVSFIPAILILFVVVIAFSLFLSAVVMCICAFAKSAKEANNYTSPIMLVVMLTSYISFVPSIVLETKTALIPVVNVCLLLKSLLVLKYDIQLIMMVLISNILYAFIAVWMLGKIYNSESVLFGESFSGIKLFERRKNIKEGSLPSVQESILVALVAILLATYVGGIVSLSQMKVGLVVQQSFYLLLPLLACLYIKGKPKEVFSLHLPKVKNVFSGVILFIGMECAMLLLSSVLTQVFTESSESVNETFDLLLNDVPFGLALLLIAALPAVCEEMLFRGYIFTAFKQKMSLPKAIFFVSLLFGLYHMSLVKLLTTGLLGVILAYAMHRSKSIFVSMLMHFLNNAFAVFTMYYGDNIICLNEEEMGMPLIVGLIIGAVIFILLGLKLLGKEEE